VNAIGDARQLVYGLVGAIAPGLPTYLYQPGSVEELPCYVVGRPQVDEGDPRALVTVTVPVHVLGRTSTTRDAEAQLELDAAADAALEALWAPSTSSSVSARLVELTPVVLTIANLEVPGYTALVVCSMTFC